MKINFPWKTLSMENDFSGKLFSPQPNTAFMFKFWIFIFQHKVKYLFAFCCFKQENYNQIVKLYREKNKYGIQTQLKMIKCLNSIYPDSTWTWSDQACLKFEDGSNAY